MFIATPIFIKILIAKNPIIKKLVKDVRKNSRRIYISWLEIGDGFRNFPENINIFEILHEICLIVLVPQQVFRTVIKNVFAHNFLSYEV